MSTSPIVRVIGGGLAGCEAALWLAGQGVQVELHEQKPGRMSPAHKQPTLAELVCSNSLKADRLDSAGGLLKAEMRRLGSSLLPVADSCRVAAGGALAVDRDAFTQAVTRMVQASPNITLVQGEVTRLEDDGLTIVASGPLTEGALAGEIARLTGEERLSFYDAAAPIVTAESLDMEKIFRASRYQQEENPDGGDYLNCPFDKEGYEAFYAALISAQRAELNTFDEPQGGTGFTVYEGCMPVEVMAARGPDTLRFGPLRPVGLRDPRTGRRPWANVQLRSENAEGTLYNMVGFQTNLKFPEQKRVFGMIPGMENAEFVRYGVMHRNTFLNSPVLLAQDLSLRTQPNIFFAGQITGFEGYMESAACGLLAARGVLARLQGKPFIPLPGSTMCGALAGYITTQNEDFQPMGANMGLLPPLEEPVKGKRPRYEKLAERALLALQQWQQENT